MSSEPIRRAELSPRTAAAAAVLGIVALFAAGCAPPALRAGQGAERARDYDRAVIEYTKAVREDPGNATARQALERVRLRAAQEHFARGRRLAAAERHEEAAIELQIASELNPTDSSVLDALREARQRLRTKLAVSRGDKTELQTLVERARIMAPPGLDLPADVVLPDSLVFSHASSRAIYSTIGRFANLNVVFDPAFRDVPLSVDLRNATLENALTAVGGPSRNFYRVTAPRTLTVIPDTPTKRREYEEAVVGTFYLSNADLKEVIDLLRIVVDVRQVSSITATNAISLKDTPERVAAAGRLIAAIDKARPEVLIDVELLEVDRTRLQEYGLQIASPGSQGISGSADVNRDNLTLQSLRSLTQADVFMTGLPGIYYRLLKNDQSTRTLASPQLRTSEGLTAQARFGERVPVPVTTFAPLAAGGVNQQPITSYNYETIGVNIDITPRTHHDDEVSLTIRVSLSSVSGEGFGGLPTFGNREITTTIRLKDGETNMLAGLIRDDERTVMSGIPGLSDLPVVGRLFGNTRRQAQQTDIILTLTPHIVRVLDVSEEDLRPFRIVTEGSALGFDAPAQIEMPPRDPKLPGEQPETVFPQPLQPKLPPKKPGCPPDCS